MKVLIDTNILLRIYDIDHSHHGMAPDALAILAGCSDKLIIFPQVVEEFWTVCTRPATAESNGLGLSFGRTSLILDDLLESFEVLDEKPAIFPRWLRLVKAHAVLGRAVYDTRLVAAMNVHAISHILTFNGPDFARYSGIVALDPLTVTAASFP